MKITRNDYYTIAALSIITILAIILRFVNLLSAQGWIDEFWSLANSSQSWLAVQFVDVHPAGFFWLVKISTFFFGPTLEAARIVSFIFGIIGVLVTYWFATELTGKRFVGLFAALMMAISVENIMQSQTARMYSLIPVMFMVFVIFFLRAYKEPNYKNWLITAFIAIAMMWTYYLLVVPIGATLLWFALKDGKKILSNKPFLWGSIFFVSSMLLLSVSFLRSMALKSTEGSLFIYKGVDVAYQILITDFGSPPLLAVCIALFAIAGGILLYRDNNDIGGYIGMVTVLSIISLCVFSFYVMILPRYMDWALGLFYTLIGFTLYSITVYFKKNWKTYLMVGFVLVVIVMSFAISLPAYYTTPHNWSGDIVEYDRVLQNVTPGADEIILLVNPGSLYMLQYYWKGNATLDRFNSVEDLQRLTPGKNMSYVLIPPDPVPAHNIEGLKIVDWLNKSATYTGDYRGLSVYRVN